MSASEIPSSVKRSPGRACARGSSRGVATAAMIPGATLIRNNQCQDQVPVIQPPTTGPTVGASTAMMPAIVVANGCCRTGNSRNTAENTAGINVPPAKPCSTRKPTKTAKSPDSAQPIEAAVKRTIAVTNSHRKVSTRVSHPVSGMAMISAIRYAV